MATALDLIKRAYRLIGVYSIGETPSADETTDGLTALNAMLASWANEKLMTYVSTLDSITLTPNVANYTIGPSGTTISTRPISIDKSSYLEWLGVSYPLTLATLDQYNAIKQKALASTLPSVLWYKPDLPNGTITLYPVPTLAMTLKLWSWKQITSFANATDVVSLPPGYEDAIAFNLAVMLAPENEVQASQVVGQRATMSKKLLKRTNFEPPQLSFDANVLGQGRFNIYTGLPA